MSALNITKNNFHEEVVQSDKPVLLDFWASWCGPCQMVGPIVDEIAGEELAAVFNVMNIPTLVVVKDGKIVNQAMGARPKEQILSLL